MLLVSPFPFFFSFFLSSFALSGGLPLLPIAVLRCAGWHEYSTWASMVRQVWLGLFTAPDTT